MWRVPLSRAALNDAGLAALFLLGGLCLQFAGLNHLTVDGVAPSSGWISLVALCAAAACQLLRSTRPGVALAGILLILAVDIVVAPSAAVWIILSDIIYACCVYGSARLLPWLYGSCVLICVTTLTLVAFDTVFGWRLILLGGIWLIAFVGSPIAYGQAVREHRNALVAERRHAQTAATLAALERTEAVATERRRLARELHDVIAGRLSSIAMSSAAAIENPALAQQVLQSVRASSVDALGEMRGMIDLLAAGDSGAQVPVGHETATLRRVDHLVSQIVGSGTVVTVDSPDPMTDLPPMVDISAYRILAEALTNATTHACGQPISLIIDVTSETLQLRVSNTLASGTVPSPEHVSRGIDNMLTRARAVGGTLVAECVNDTFLVDAHLPLTPTPRLVPPS